MHVSALKESKYIKRADVGNGVLVTITHLTKENVAMENAKPDMKWALHFEEMEKPLILNTTNSQRIAKFLGEETDDWTGKKIVLFDDPTVSFGGEEVGGVRVRAPKSNTPPKPAEEEPPF